MGSYGTIDKETGEFLAEGNIYNDKADFEFDRGDMTLKPQEQPHADDTFIVNSWGVSSKVVDLGSAA